MTTCFSVSRRSQFFLYIFLGKIRGFVLVGFFRLACEPARASLAHELNELNCWPNSTKQAKLLSQLIRESKQAAPSQAINKPATNFV